MNLRMEIDMGHSYGKTLYVADCEFTGSEAVKMAKVLDDCSVMSVCGYPYVVLGDIASDCANCRYYLSDAVEVASGKSFSTWECIEAEKEEFFFHGGKRIL